MLSGYLPQKLATDCGNCADSSSCIFLLLSALSRLALFALQTPALLCGGGWWRAARLAVVELQTVGFCLYWASYVLLALFFEEVKEAVQGACDAALLEFEQEVKDRRQLIADLKQQLREMKTKTVVCKSFPQNLYTGYLLAS